jgi:hypothetical protein
LISVDMHTDLLDLVRRRTRPHPNDVSCTSSSDGCPATKCAARYSRL